VSETPRSPLKSGGQVEPAIGINSLTKDLRDVEELVKLKIMYSHKWCQKNKYTAIARTAQEHFRLCIAYSEFVCIPSIQIYYRLLRSMPS